MARSIVSLVPVVTAFPTAMSITQAQKDALLGVVNGGTHTQGTLEKAFLTLAGKIGTADYNAVQTAFQTVLSGGGAAKFESGSVNDKETDSKNL